jgi:hypothetical protein
MKLKLFSAFAGVLLAGALGAEEPASPSKPHALSLDTSFRLDTEQVYRGQRLGHQVFRPKVELGLSLFEGGKVYLGNRNWISRHSTPNWHDFYVGFTYAFTNLFSADLGFAHRLWRDFERISEETRHEGPQPDGTPGPWYEYTFQRVNMIKEVGGKDHSEELYVGLKTNTFLSPSLYYSYNTTWRRHNLEGRANYTYDLSSLGFSGSALEFSAKVGYDHTRRPYSHKDFFSLMASSPLAPKLKKGYLYGGAGADLVYAFNEAAKASIGVRYEGIQKRAWAYTRTESGKTRRHLCWFTAAVEGSF